MYEVDRKIKFLDEMFVFNYFHNFSEISNIGKRENKKNNWTAKVPKK